MNTCLKVSTLLLFSLILSAFIPAPAKKDPGPSLQGVWIYHSYDKGTRIYQRAGSFRKNKPGIQFKSKGELTKRQNIGWCGTPPITYGNYKGSWNKPGDSSLVVTYTYWGGKIRETWQLVSLSKKELHIRSIKTEYLDSAGNPGR